MAGSCYLFLGNARQARGLLEITAASLTDGSKAQAIVLGNLALAHIQQGNLDQAAGRLHQAIDIIELNEAFAAQSLACLRELGVADDDPRVNPNGGAIALGHPLGMSGARLVLTALHELEATKKRYALATMCIGVGQGMAMVIEATG